MTDTVLIGLITNVGLIVTALISKWDRKKISEKVDNVTTDVVHVKNTLVKVKEQTDGIKDQLVDTAGRLGEAIGKAKGREELSQEIAKTDPFIIMLDDDEDDLGLIKRLINKIGIEKFLPFADEDLFLEQLTKDVNVYIIDHKLPKRNGLNISQSILSANENNFIIISTGSSLGIADIYLNSGVDNIIFKTDKNFEANLEKYIREGLKKVALRK